MLAPSRTGDLGVVSSAARRWMWGVAPAAASSLVLAAGLFLLGSSREAATGSPSGAAPNSGRAAAGEPGPPESTTVGGLDPRPSVRPGRAAVVPVRLSTVQGLGDSVPAATGCGCTSYVVQLARSMQDAEGSPVDAVNDSADGQTSAGLLAEVTQGGIRATPDRVTVITVGANDFDPGPLSGPGCSMLEVPACYHQGLQTLQTNIDAILTALVAGGGDRGPVVVTGYWNVFLDGDVAAAIGTDYVRDSDELTRAINTVLQVETQRHGLLYVDLYTPFKAEAGGNDTPLLAADGDHPSADGHALIAALLRTALRPATR